MINHRASTGHKIMNRGQVKTMRDYYTVDTDSDPDDQGRRQTATTVD